MLNFSPKMISQYFDKEECERSLFLDTFKTKYQENPVLQRLKERGNRHEAVALNYLKQSVGKKLKVKISDGKNKHFSLQETIRLLKKLSEGYYYQLTIKPTPQFYKDFNMDHKKVKITLSRPDLIEVKKVDGRFKLYIIDIKSSQSIKPEHVVQVTLYAILLKYFLKEYNINAEVDMKTAYIWREIELGPKKTDIGNILPKIEDFLRSLTKFSEKSFEDLLTITTQKCEWCKYFSRYCKDKIIENKLVSGLPYISVYAQRKLHDMNIKTIEELKNAIEDDKKREKLLECYWFKKRMNKLPKTIESFLTGEVCLYENFVVNMAKFEHYKIILTAQKDQVTDNIIAASILQDRGYGKNKYRYDSKVFITDNEQDYKRVSYDFVNSLYSMLKKIDIENKKIDIENKKKKKKSIQVYVMDNYEKKNIIEMIEEQLPRVEAQKLLFYFYNERLGKEDDHPETYASFPIITLTTVCTHMFAIPSYFAYKLGDLSEKINIDKDQKKEGEISYLFKPKEEFISKISNIMIPNWIYKLWETQDYANKEKIKESIEKELKRRMYAMCSLIYGIRHRSKYFVERKNENGEIENKEEDRLLGYSQIFEFSDAIDIKNPLLSKLYFMWIYETLLDCHEARGKRAVPRKEAEVEGTILSLNCEKVGEITQKEFECRFRLINKDAIDNISESGFFEGILGKDTKDTEKKFVAFNDYWYKTQQFYNDTLKKNTGLYYAAIKKIEMINDNVYLDVRMPCGETTDIIEGENYIYGKRKLRLHFKNVLGLIEDIDKNRDNKNIQKFFQTATTTHKKKYDIGKKMEDDRISEAKLTKSQMIAFENFLRSSLTVIWGPPGTGKTFLIADSLLLYILLRCSDKKSPKILVTANTHKAIENCLEELLELKGKEEVFNEIKGTDIIKLDRVKDKSLKSIVVKKAEAKKYFECDNATIIGATATGVQKLCKDTNFKFDVVVIDEGSQMTLPTALSSFYRVSDDGRVLIAGDDKQLPPIIKGKYNFENQEDNIIFGSIFQYFKIKDETKIEGKEEEKGKEIICQLLENFRMCEGINAYPRKLYGEAYKPADQERAERKIRLLTILKSNDLINYILDPNYPVVLCVFDDVPAGKENPYESQLIAELINNLYNNLEIEKNMKDKNKNRDRETEFWAKGVSGVFPYHVQIRALKNILVEKYNFDSEKISVGTVDALQGAQREVIITGYGGADYELAESQLDFIYSLERLNVAITRPRSKNIVFIPKKLFNPSLRILTNEEIEPGVSYMLGLKEHVKKSNDSKVFKYDNKSIKIYRR